MESQYQRGRKDYERVHDQETEIKTTEDVKHEEKEEQASNISEGKDSSDSCSSDYDEVVKDLEDSKKNSLSFIFRKIDFRYDSSLKRNILESIEEYHEKFIDLSKNLNLKVTSLQDELEDKNNEIERLKSNLISQEVVVSKELEESRKDNVDLKTQIEEAKRMEEVLKN